MNAEQNSPIMIYLLNDEQQIQISDIYLLIY